MAKKPVKAVHRTPSKRPTARKPASKLLSPQTKPPRRKPF